MLTLDSNKLQIPIGIIKGWDRSKFHLNTKTDETGIIGERYTVKPSEVHEVLGLKSISYSPASESFVIETSAKILKEEYPKGISLNTFERLIDEITKTNIIDIDCNDVYDKGHFFSFDITNNIIMDRDNLMPYFEALNTVRNNPRYSVKPYLEKGNTGIVFSGDYKSKKSRLILYDKMKDIRRDKLLLENVPYPLLYKSFNNSIRIEQNIVSFKEARKTLNILGDISVKSILNAANNPNYNLFQTIKSSVQYDVFNEYQNISFNDERKMRGDFEIIKQFEYDIQKIMAYIGTRVKGKTSRYKKEIMNAI